MTKIIGMCLLMVALVCGGAFFYEDIAKLDFTNAFMEIGGDVNPSTVLTSTYKVNGQSMIISMWLVDTRNQQVVSAGSFTVAMNHEFE